MCRTFMTANHNQTFWPKKALEWPESKMLLEIVEDLSHSNTLKNTKYPFQKEVIKKKIDK